MHSLAKVIEIDIDGRSFMVRPVGSWVLESSNVVAEALAVSLDKPLEWAVGFYSSTPPVNFLPPSSYRDKRRCLVVEGRLMKAAYCCSMRPQISLLLMS